MQPTYRYAATSVAGFVQQLAVAYLAHGYWFWVYGRIPDGKDPRLTDAKLLQQYDIAVSKWTRARRKRAGVAGVHYLRYQREFVLVATHGQHRFFDEEKDIRDARHDPISFHGYSVSYKRGVDGCGHPSVRIGRETWRGIKAYFLEGALHRSVERLTQEFRAIPFEPYAPIKRQLGGLLRAVNVGRAQAGFEPVPAAALRWQRQPVRPFEILLTREASPGLTAML